MTVLRKRDTVEETKIRVSKPTKFGILGKEADSIAAANPANGQIYPWAIIVGAEIQVGSSYQGVNLPSCSTSSHIKAALFSATYHVEYVSINYVCLFIFDDRKITRCTFSGPSPTIQHLLQFAALQFRKVSEGDFEKGGMSSPYSLKYATKKQYV